VLKYLYGDQDLEALMARFLSLDSVEAFQVFFSRYTVRTIIEKSSGGLSDEGADKLDPALPFLFVANHRDIVLDAAIMQLLLHIHGHKTTQITFGENLMFGQMLQDLGKLNKMFTFFRGGSKITQYRKAVTNSAYINHVIREEKESIWIAQRNGRTKNGDDRTQAGLIKMFGMGSKDLCQRLKTLNIVPVTISYEIEPCDVQKVRELYLTRRGPYKKASDEDLKSILAGITGQKGRIHYVFGQPLNAFIEALSQSDLHDNDIINRVVEEIDRQVHQDYKCWPGNFVACDLMRGDSRYSNLYTAADKKAFLAALEQKCTFLQDLDQEEVRTMFLELYANPVLNKE
jgi:hypothetical protein